MFAPRNLLHRGSVASVCRALTLVVLLGVCATASNAASINYGNFGPVPPGVIFQAVTESSGTDAVPLYGPPTPFSVGLDFNPMSFIAFGSSGSSDITDGQLNFGIASNPFVGINTVSLFESGDYTLTGTGTAATQDFAGAIMRITVTQIDGINVAPIALAPVNGSVGFNLIANSGIVQPWSLGLSLNVSAALAGLGIQFTTGATALQVSIDNQLVALSEANSIALIQKKDFIITVGTNVVPEPASTALFFSAGLAGLFLLRRPKR